MELRITDLTHKVKNGAVVSVFWEAVMSDAGFSFSDYGKLEFFPDPDDPDFIPYGDLTEEIVKGWVLDKIGADIEQRLVAKIGEKENPTFTSGLPWTQNEEES